MEIDAAAYPLGARPALRLTAEQVRMLRALQDYDLTPVRNRLQKDGAMPSTWLDDAVLEFRRYLALRAIFPGQSLQMFSRQIDTVWHTCLLFSRLYADFCAQAFGHFVHHEPTTEPAGAQQLEADWAAFQTAYEAAFGPLPRLWQMARPTPEAPYES